MYCATAEQLLANETLPPTLTSQKGVDLLERYPAHLKVADVDPARARSWTLSASDVFSISGFHLVVGNELSIQTGPADLGVGHCADGAVFAVIIPKKGGQLISEATNQPENIENIWLRFHPEQISSLFPSQSVFNGGNSNLIWQMRAIANVKIYASWQAGGRVMIPSPMDTTVDVDTKNGIRRFFSVNEDTSAVKYSAKFQLDAVPKPPQLTPELATAAFDQLYHAFDRHYAMFVLRPEVNWPELRDKYRPLALKSKSAYEFADICAQMLGALEDLHVWLTLAGEYVPVYNRPRLANANPAADQIILGRIEKSGDVAWTTTANGIGYIAIDSWADPKIPEICGTILDEMRNTRGLIIDVRLNGGGSESLAKEFAGRFLKDDFVYAYSQFRDGPDHTNLTQKYERKVEPCGPWRYEHPVIVLIGQKCMSSNESFIEMMAGDPEATTMGDHTCGSSGDPLIVELPLNMTVSVPQWIDYRKDGTPLDRVGVQPDIRFASDPGAFEGQRDDLLLAALARLGHIPAVEPVDKQLADLSLSNLPDHTKDMREESRDASRPGVIWVFPTNNCESVRNTTDLHIRFDRPMEPFSLKLTWESGGFLDCDFPKYDAARHEFTIPVHLAPGTLQQIVVNEPAMPDIGESRKEFPRDGFQSLDHRLAGIFVWRFRTRPLSITSGFPPPEVMAISPPPEALVPPQTFVKIQFNQPMAPPTEALPYMQEESDADVPQLICRIEYDAVNHSFLIPLVLPAHKSVEFALDGFKSAAGAPARPITLRYKVSSSDDPKASTNPTPGGLEENDLSNLLSSLKQKRLGISSLVERIQNMMLSEKNGLFFQLDSQDAIFKYQKPDQFYADVTEPMLSCSSFRIGSDGHCWWLDLESFAATNFIVCPEERMSVSNISICDPFGLTHEAPAAMARELNFAGARAAGRTNSPLLQEWNIDSAPCLIQWQIDPRIRMPTDVSTFTPYAISRMRFNYTSVNKRLPASAFAVPAIPDLYPGPVGPLGNGYTHWFVQIRDGSDGRMNTRWGKIGPHKYSSCGLN